MTKINSFNFKNYKLNNGFSFLIKIIGTYKVTFSSEKSLSTEEKLFLRYLEICNQALDSNKDKFPYKQILNTAQNLLDDKTVSLAVYDDSPKVTYDISIHDNQIDIVDKNDENKPDDAWHVNLSYLEKVVQNPEEYINNPAKIDWDWLKSRVHM